MWCMDDLFPIFQFVVVRSKIRHLGAEIHMMDDLIEPHLEHGEFGLMFTTLKVCFHHLSSLFDQLYYMIIKPGFCNVPLTPTLHIISSFFFQCSVSHSLLQTNYRLYSSHSIKESLSSELFVNLVRMVYEGMNQQV